MIDRDVEMGYGNRNGNGNGSTRWHKGRRLSSNSGRPREPRYENTKLVRQPYYKKVIESFKRDPNLNVTPNGVIGANGHVFRSEFAAQNTANSPLARKLKGRHLQMIAMGGSIGGSHYMFRDCWEDSKGI